MDISGQVLAVTGRNVNTKFGPKIAYDIAFSDGRTYTAWKAEVATKAQQLQNQQVDARYDEKTNVGNDGTVYTNYTLQDIALSGQLPSEAAAAIGISSAPVVNGANIPGGGPTIPMQQKGGGMSPERESKIVKQSCLSTAFNFVGQLYHGTGAELYGPAVELASILAKELYAEVYGQKNIAQTPRPLGYADGELTPAELAKFANDALPGAVKVGAETPEW